jgi:Glycosyltransferases, probably involved in cell wall biogenesis
MGFLLYYQYVVLFILGLMLLNLVLNNFVFKNVENYSLGGQVLKNPPLISVLIPARNEAGNISRCLKSLLKQDYPNLEIIVLDDNSTDGTSREVEVMAQKDNRVRLVEGAPLADGWIGKNFASHQLAKYAKGEYFIFTDADTLHFPKTVSSAFGALITTKVDALSIYPRQIMVTFAERMTVPIINTALQCFIPFILIKKSKSPLFCTALGQFMMFKREAYEKIGGYESIKGNMVDDIQISKRVKKAGYKFMIFDGRNAIYCRMYKNLKGVITGLAKSIYPAFNGNVLALFSFTGVLTATLLVPFILLPLGAFLLDWPAAIIRLMIFQIIIVLAIKTIFAIRYKQRMLDILLAPVSMAIIDALIFLSFFQAKYGEGLLWKGRVYDVSVNDKTTLVRENHGIN